ncbi:DJ-1/PfpI family protein [Planctomycetota bacterium]|nr:DJ-1/PfpI family protein [Planctomycetota bacterium]
MSAKNILILAGDFVEDYEIMVPFQMLVMIGHNTHVVCPDKKKGDTIRTAIHDFEGDQTYTEKPGHNFALNTSFKDVKPDDYDALLIAGGRAPEYIRLNDRVLEITRHFANAEKPIAAICHGIQVLTAANVVRDYTLTAYHAVKPEIELAGGKYIEIPMDAAHTDRNLVTAPAWPAHPAFIKQFLDLLGTTITL